MAKEVVAEFSITHKILNESLLRTVLERLSTFDAGRWGPDRYNNSEPVKWPFDRQEIDKVIQLWMTGGTGIMLKRLSIPKYDLDFSGERPNLVVKVQASLYLENKFLRDPAGLEASLNFAKLLYELFRPAYGHAEHAKDFSAKNQLTYKQGVTVVQKWVGRKLDKCLPGVYWANWFGPEYVKFFGAEKFKSAPCYRNEELSDGGYLILISPSPFDYGEAETAEAERALMDHLGVDAFFDTKQHERDTRSPWSG